MKSKLPSGKSLHLCCFSGNHNDCPELYRFEGDTLQCICKCHNSKEIKR